ALLRPPPGLAICYLDYEQQEFGEAAALSGDKAMMEAYRSGDPYMAFAKMAGAVPQDGTKETHGEVRDLYKQCVLGVQYGMQAGSLAVRLNKTGIVTRDLLQQHYETFRTYWKWTRGVINFAASMLYLESPFGWRVRVTSDTAWTSLQNYMMQS